MPRVFVQLLDYIQQQTFRLLFKCQNVGPDFGQTSEWLVFVKMLGEIDLVPLLCFIMVYLSMAFNF